MLKEFFEKKKNVLLVNTAMVAITIAVMGLIFGKLSEPGWFIRVFIFTGLVIGAGYLLRSKNRKGS